MAVDTPQNVLPTGKHCLCNACGEVFAYLSLFDKHLKGPYKNLRCESPEKLGMVRDKYGAWTAPVEDSTGE